MNSLAQNGLDCICAFWALETEKQALLQLSRLSCLALVLVELHLKFLEFFLASTQNIENFLYQTAASKLSLSCALLRPSSKA